MKDLLFGGTSNLSRHTNFTPPLLEDISYEPGGNTAFFAEGNFRGTPMRTLPARIRAGIKLGNEYYATDGQFIRDSIYRSIQRGLLARNPAYKVGWDQAQKTITETAYSAIFARQLKDAVRWTEVFFKDAISGQWVETDSVMVISDVLFVVEAKAGVLAMHSPATDFDKHERTIRNLIINAYRQCARFIEYVASAPEVPLYNRVEGEYREVGRLRRNSFRLILPIGLTVEAFTPFSAMSKELQEISPILGRHPFISMSVDDLFVLNRFLPTTGMLVHYLEVRQQAAGIVRAMIFDEIEHLGAYITNNRFDLSIREQLQEADMVTWDSFGDVVDKHFEGDAWKTEPPPRQGFAPDLDALLNALDRYRPTGWLAADGQIRDMDGSTRAELANCIAQLKPIEGETTVKRFLLGGETPIQLWLCGGGAAPEESEIYRQGQISCLAADAKHVRVLRISYYGDEITGCECQTVSGPAIIQLNYSELKVEADRQRSRFVKLGDHNKGRR